MIRQFLLSIFLLGLALPVISSVVKGTVIDAGTGEELIGSTIYIPDLQEGTISGLDGSYLIREVKQGTYTLRCSFIGYETIEKKIELSGDQTLIVDFRLSPSAADLSAVDIVAQREQSTETSARSSERNSAQVINVVSARTIELSPDLNVANVLQRMSGVTLDKSTSGDGQYSLVRGMDKRYNYTLVNGIKIPSTNNKHRYVSLDLFPSEMVDRIEVTKALTPDMEGDAVAGVVNLVMKNAPDQFLLQAHASLGYSLFFNDFDFLTFDRSVLNNKSPYERNAQGYRAVPSDFATSNLIFKTVDFPVNRYGNITVGNRFFKKKLGWIVSGSYQGIYSGKHALYFKDDLSRDGQNLPVLTDFQERLYLEKKDNFGFLNKFDYQINPANRLQLFAAYVDIAGRQIRNVQSTDLTVSYNPENGNETRSFTSRFRYNDQNIVNLTLQGEHKLSNTISAQWSAVYSLANNRTPEEATVEYGNSLENFLPVRQYVDFDGSDRIWRHNSDEDKAGYLNFTFKPAFINKNSQIKFGGMYRDKTRTSFFNKYTLNAIVKVSTPDTSYTSFYSEKGVDWETYDQINWQVYNPRGTIAVGENYDAYERVGAGYAMFRGVYTNLEVTGGLRIENTSQGYYMKYPIGEPQPDGEQNYTDVLPSIHFKYSLFTNQYLRLSYYRAINKPGFQEIVPYIDASEEPYTAGNKNLKHAIADNIDFRYEYFPDKKDQILAGLFWKYLKDPIEYAFDKFMNISQQIVYMPVNTDKAINYGFELDVIRYYRQWGVKANYTRTWSDISTRKLSRDKDENGNDVTTYVSQSRPLFGQSANVGNISLLYKSTETGISGQLAFSYTGDRIYTVSRYIDNDLWQKGYWQLDISAEKRFKNGFSLFIKGNNLLNSHVKVYIRKTNPLNDDVPYHTAADANTLVRDEYSMSSYLIGLRYKFE